VVIQSEITFLVNHLVKESEVCSLISVLKISGLKFVSRIVITSDHAIIVFQVDLLSDTSYCFLW
jgi:hypothetical protein